MRKTRKCAFCGKEFTCNSGSQRYCSEHCAEVAKSQRKKKQQNFLKAVQPVIDIASLGECEILLTCNVYDWLDSLQKVLLFLLALSLCCLGAMF